MPENKETIFIVSQKKPELNDYFTKELSNNYNLQFYESINQAYYSVYVSPPSLILIDVRYAFGESENNNKITDLNDIRIIRKNYNNPSDNTESIALKNDCSRIYDDIFNATDDIQKDNVISNIPLVFILSRNFNFKKILDCGYAMRDYIKEPLLKGELHYKVKISALFSRTQLDANPLTKLPGNSSIINEVKNKILSNINCSFAYIDIDNFKSYNDKYGFLSGDEIIMLTSRLIASTTYDISKNHKRNIKRNVFIGHIGGDDFVIISHPNDIVEICSNIISNFDKIIPSFYDETDKSNGYIETHDRSNILRKIPLMSLSISIITNINKKVSHYGEISEITSSLKYKAKSTPGSKIIIDKRGNK
jgi:diguanylate cyclase (GGDEF)-like protein